MTKWSQQYNDPKNNPMLDTGEESPVQPQFLEQTFVANIIKAFTKGIPVTTNNLKPIYDDVSEIQDFSNNFETLKKAEIIKNQKQKEIEENAKIEAEKQKKDVEEKLKKLEKYEQQHESNTKKVDENILKT